MFSRKCMSLYFLTNLEAIIQKSVVTFIIRYIKKFEDSYFAHKFEDLTNTIIFSDKKTPSALNWRRSITYVIEQAELRSATAWL